jgi:transcriptional regulator of acetoin/glycerol metabolism
VPPAEKRDSHSGAQTRDQSWSYRSLGRAASDDAVPGLLMLFSGGTAALLPIPLRGGTRTLGRGDVGGVPLDDTRMSKRHAEVAFDGERWHVRDLGSRNGTFVDCQRVEGKLTTSQARVLRVGDSLFGLLSDVRGYQGASIEVRDGTVLGPSLGEVWERIERAAREGDRLHLWGESGTGKELAARRFHAAGPRSDGPFVAVNCASIPPNLAERLLFGAKKGAYSGASTDVDGYLQSAHTGTLFLDEIAELEASVQAKLLRVLESKQVLALGATRPRAVDIALCSATHRDLRTMAAAGGFREDLFFRIGRPAVSLPPLRDRLEDIAWLVQSTLAGLDAPRPHVSLVEACLTRAWPGNVRELIAAMGVAASEAARRGARRVDASHLEADSGLDLAAAPQRPAPVPVTDVAAVAEALRVAGGNVTGAARALGWHRTQLRRWITKHGVRLKP